MKRTLALLVALGLLAAPPALAQSANISFFITSSGPGEGADLGGLEGADGHCALLAYEAGAGDLTWVAYLSAAAAVPVPASPGGSLVLAAGAATPPPPGSPILPPPGSAPYVFSAGRGFVPVT